MANEQNLIPFTSDQNREEAKKNGQKGGVASGEARRKKKTLKEIGDMLDDGVEFRNKRNGEIGKLVSLADGYRLKIEYGFSKWYPDLDSLKKDWEEM